MSHIRLLLLQMSYLSTDKYLLSDGSGGKQADLYNALSYKCLSCLLMSYLERKGEDTRPATTVIRKHWKCWQ